MNLFQDELQAINTIVSTVSPLDNESKPSVVLADVIPLIHSETGTLMGFLRWGDFGYTFVTVDGDEGEEALDDLIDLVETLETVGEVPARHDPFDEDDDDLNVESGSRSGRMDFTVPSYPSTPQLDPDGSTFRKRVVDVFAKMLADADEAEDLGVPVMRTPAFRAGTELAASELGINHEAQEASAILTLQRHQREAQFHSQAGNYAPVDSYAYDEDSWDDDDPFGEDDDEGLYDDEVPEMTPSQATARQVMAQVEAMAQLFPAGSSVFLISPDDEPYIAN